VSSSSSPEGQTGQSAVFEDPEQQGEYEGVHSKASIERERIAGT
jgi:hypothetical protein